MPPASPDTSAADEVAALIRAATAEFDEAADELDKAIAEVRAEQDERAGEPDPELVRALHRASRSPGAPESLRRVAARVERGQLSWSEVIDGSADPDVAALRGAAFATAREHFDDSDPGSGPGSGPAAGTAGQDGPAGTVGP